MLSAVKDCMTQQVYQIGVFRRHAEAKRRGKFVLINELKYDKETEDA